VGHQQVFGTLADVVYYQGDGDEPPPPSLFRLQRAITSLNLFEALIQDCVVVGCLDYTFPPPEGDIDDRRIAKEKRKKDQKGKATTIHLFIFIFVISHYLALDLCLAHSPFRTQNL
jgi:hypothetical protein